MTLKILKFYSFKKGQLCEAGAEQLEAQLSVLNEPNLPNPFQVITDWDIEEADDDEAMTRSQNSDIDIELLKNDFDI